MNQSKEWCGRWWGPWPLQAGTDTMRTWILREVPKSRTCFDRSAAQDKVQHILAVCCVGCGGGGSGPLTVERGEIRIHGIHRAWSVMTSHKGNSKILPAVGERVSKGLFELFLRSSRNKAIGSRYSSVITLFLPSGSWCQAGPNAQTSSRDTAKYCRDDSTYTVGF